ncbi:MAG: DUF481 domain-containing protein [Gemmatimonadetes bacterium]|nr:DUF481 domain-containing protein [Gemmatimonadota bacterium]
MTPETHFTPLSRNGLLLLVALIGALPFPLSAQVNVEALRQENPPLGYSGTFGGDLTIRTGNVDLVQVGLNARLYRVRESVTRLIVGNAGLGLQGGSRFASSGLFHYRETYQLNDLISPEWYAQWNYDRPQLLNFRAVTGGGVRTSFARGDWGQFGMGAALMLEHERLALPDTAVHPDQTTTFRGSYFLTLRLVPSERLVITSTTYLQPAIGDLGDLRTLANFQLATSVTDELDLTVSFDLRYDSRPPDDISALDTNLKTGLRYRY